MDFLNKQRLAFWLAMADEHTMGSYGSKVKRDEGHFKDVGYCY